MDRRNARHGSAVNRPARAITDNNLLPRFAQIVGGRYAITDPAMQEPYLREMRDLYHGHTPMVLRPGSVAEVSAILKLANETRTPIVPQGGNTGLVGGQLPHHGEIVLSLNRMDRIREVDATSNTITAEAGVALGRDCVRRPGFAGGCARTARHRERAHARCHLVRTDGTARHRRGAEA